MLTEPGPFGRNAFFTLLDAGASTEGVVADACALAQRRRPEPKLDRTPSSRRIGLRAEGGKP
ncbi:hypothetical protein [Methylobacterium sp. J-068]|uniref:hypothetical protein n=1 Tax=Methylobacterium sp. J-068 TaxID=2836649 RepID=UPI001FBB3638|nr:hypothetical protein [Methylobacterium sp. J-068]MCJ2035915.1 hypothetical protein [Methylobacterium sp. J-068]